ncbi:unnamed protein product [Orchesella dallaii]|uniref:Uncharacterized protein n=1 Tax=Orchesella dallaii TaxID=48710 RepID=A0ABP1QDK0_9HEXA
MFFRTPRFIRRWIRRRMHPMAEESALSTKQKLSYAYIFFAWNAFALVIWQLSKGNKYWPVTQGLAKKEDFELDRPAYGWAKALKIEKAEVYRFGSHGLKKTEDIQIDSEEKKSQPEASQK